MICARITLYCESVVRLEGQIMINKLAQIGIASGNAVVFLIVDLCFGGCRDD